MRAITESCSVCGKEFDVQFRYQMEERGGGFSFYCSQRCLDVSQRAGGDGLVGCDACGKQFRVELVSHILYVRGARRYACSVECRAQLGREAIGARLGDIASEPASDAPGPAPAQPAADHVDRTPPGPPVVLSTDPVRGGTPAPAPAAPTNIGPTVVPLVPRGREAGWSRLGLGPGEHGRTVPGGASPASDAVASGAAPASSAASGAAPEPRLIAVFNHKGGTGKTTTSVSLAAGIAQRGKRVLLVDTDSQGNVAVSLDVVPERTLYHVLVMGLPVAEAAVRVRDGLDLIASNETLAAAELYLAGRQNRDRVLAGRLAGCDAAYDYVVLDCSPSLSLMNQNALVFADSVLVPVACDYLSLVGVRQVIKTVRNVNRLLHHPVQIWGVLPTFYDARARICREAIETMQQHFGPRCLAPIRAAIKVKEAPAQGQTIFEYAAGSSVAEDYARLVERVIGPAGDADALRAVPA